MFKIAKQINLTQGEIEALISAAYTQIEEIAKLKGNAEMRTELKRLKKAIKKLQGA